MLIFTLLLITDFQELTKTWLMSVSRTLVALQASGAIFLRTRSAAEMPTSFSLSTRHWKAGAPSPRASMKTRKGKDFGEVMTYYPCCACACLSDTHAHTQMNPTKCNPPPLCKSWKSQKFQKSATNTVATGNMKAQNPPLTLHKETYPISWWWLEWTLHCLCHEYHPWQQCMGELQNAVSSPGSCT